MVGLEYTTYISKEYCETLIIQFIHLVLTTCWVFKNEVFDGMIGTFVSESIHENCPGW